MESKSASPCIVLTAAVRVSEGMCFMLRTDTSLRADDYRRSFAKWLATPSVERIVLVENSGYETAEFVHMAQQYPKKRVECLSFACPPFPGHRGKGYGEALSLDYALRTSVLLRESSHFIKASGRYYLRNVASVMALLRASPELQAVCNLQRNLTWADSRVFGASVEFLERYFVPIGDIIDDTEGVCFENVLARAVHRLMSEGGRWAMLPRALHIEGVQGTNNKAYSLNPARMALREAVHWARLKLLGGSYSSVRQY